MAHGEIRYDWRFLKVVISGICRLMHPLCVKWPDALMNTVYTVLIILFEYCRYEPNCTAWCPDLQVYCILYTVGPIALSCCSSGLRHGTRRQKSVLCYLLITSLNSSLYSWSGRWWQARVSNFQAAGAPPSTSPGEPSVTRRGSTVLSTWSGTGRVGRSMWSSASAMALRRRLWCLQVPCESFVCGPGCALRQLTCHRRHHFYTCGHRRPVINPHCFRSYLLISEQSFWRFILNDVRYINPRFTYLLNYLLTPSGPKNCTIFHCNNFVYSEPIFIIFGTFWSIRRACKQKSPVKVFAVKKMCSFLAHHVYSPCTYDPNSRFRFTFYRSIEKVKNTSKFLCAWLYLSY